MDAVQVWALWRRFALVFAMASMVTATALADELSAARSQPLVEVSHDVSLSPPVWPSTRYNEASRTTATPRTRPALASTCPKGHSRVVEAAWRVNLSRNFTEARETTRLSLSEARFLQR